MEDIHFIRVLYRYSSLQVSQNYFHIWIPFFEHCDILWLVKYILTVVQNVRMAKKRIVYSCLWWQNTRFFLFFLRLKRQYFVKCKWHHLHKILTCSYSFVLNSHFPHQFLFLTFQNQLSVLFISVCPTFLLFLLLHDLSKKIIHPCVAQLCSLGTTKFCCCFFLVCFFFSNNKFDHSLLHSFIKQYLNLTILFFIAWSNKKQCSRQLQCEVPNSICFISIGSWKCFQRPFIWTKLNGLYSSEAEIWPIQLYPSGDKAVWGKDKDFWEKVAIATKL